MSHKNFGVKSWLQPMPVAIIGTYCADGTPNAMSAAWVGQWGPSQVAFCLAKHTTTANLELNAEFTIALADKRNLVAADYVGITPAAKDPAKVATCGWTVEKAENVNAPVFTSLPLTLECRVAQKIGQTEPGGACNVIADIVNVRCQEEFLNADGMPDLTKMQLIAYDSIANVYRLVGDCVGNAFKDGAKLSK